MNYVSIIKIFITQSQIKATYILVKLIFVYFSFTFENNLISYGWKQLDKIQFWSLNWFFFVKYFSRCSSSKWVQNFIHLRVCTFLQKLLFSIFFPQTGYVYIPRNTTHQNNLMIFAHLTRNIWRLLSHQKVLCGRQFEVTQKKRIISEQRRNWALFSDVSKNLTDSTVIKINFTIQVVSR